MIADVDTIAAGFDDYGPYWIAKGTCPETGKSYTTGNYYDRDNAEVLPQLAAWAHEAWAGWMRHMVSVGRIVDGDLLLPAEHVARWQRQMATPFGDLPEAEQRSDYEQATKIIACIQEALC